MPDEFVVVVSGLPRSGTSLMMPMLARGDVPAITDSTSGRLLSMFFSPPTRGILPERGIGGGKSPIQMEVFSRE